jgi:DNA primase
MGILDEDVARVREVTDIVALISEHVGLKRVGRRYQGLCPFHTEKTPSFSVNPELGVFHCLAGETQVITWEGVRPIAELAGGVHRVLSTRGRWIDAPFRSYGVQRLHRVVVTRNRQRKEIYATEGHRWFVRKQPAKRGERIERVTTELRPGDSLCWTFPSNRLRHARLSPMGVAHGIVYGDGSRFNKGSAVDLHGDKDAELLKWFPLNNTYQCNRKSATGDVVPYVKVVDLPAYYKEQPSLDEAPSYLLGWLAGYFAADGCVAADGTLILNSAHRDDLEFVQMLCLRLGIGTYGITTQTRRGIDGRMSELHRVHLINEDLIEDFFLISQHRLLFNACRKQWVRRGWVVRAVEATDRVEEVYCAEVPQEHAFALEDNILTGNCFGCQKSGDAITFVREVEHLDFVEAVERLAGRAGITLRYDDASFSKERQRKTRLHEAVGEAIACYHKLLLESPGAGNARGYVRSRGFDGDVARKFSLGFAPDEYDVLSKHLQNKKFARQDIVDAGLAFVNRAQKLQDQFRGRLMFPIWDARGEPVGFGGRTLDGQGPKYKNSPETAIYQKSRLLYGLQWAKGEIVARGEVVICEGYTDVMAFALSDVPIAVATCGTALADDHFLTLKNLARKVTLAYDADAAGQAAAERCYQWEQRFEVQFQVADLGQGRDPADVWRDDPAALAAAVTHATPFLEFRLDRLLAASDFSSLEGRARTAQAAAALVAEHPNDLVRDQYVMKLAGQLDIDPDRLRETVTRARTQRRSARPQPHSQPDPDRPARPHVVDRRELDALRWTVLAPELMSGRLDVAFFADPVARDAFNAVCSAPWPDCLSRATPEASTLLQRLAVEDPGPVAATQDVITRVVVNIVEASSQRLLASMLRQGDERSAAVKALIDALVRERAEERWSAAETVAEQLVGWITDGGDG